MTSDNPLLGTWSLIAWFNETESGKKIYPLGEQASGYIHYAQDGFVFVHLSASNRRLYRAHDPFQGSPEEDAAAMKSHITYAGSYSYFGTHVVHHVTQSSCPNWVGTEQRREVSLSGDRLRLSAAGAVFQGETVTAYVDWTRASR